MNRIATVSHFRGRTAHRLYWQSVLALSRVIRNIPRDLTNICTFTNRDDRRCAKQEDETQRVEYTHRALPLTYNTGHLGAQSSGKDTWSQARIPAEVYHESVRQKSSFAPRSAILPCSIVGVHREFGRSCTKTSNRFIRPGKSSSNRRSIKIEKS